MRRLLTPGWLAMHTLMVAAVATMLALGWWQLTRATGGNGPSWGYALQWPIFAGFVVFVWAREVRRAWREQAPGPAAAGPSPTGPLATAPVPAGRPVRTPGAAGPAEAAFDDADDPELAAYNRYLAWLAAHPRARAVDYPG